VHIIQKSLRKIIDAAWEGGTDVCTVAFEVLISCNMHWGSGRGPRNRRVGLQTANMQEAALDT
jgi:hypothetical protein